MMPSCIRSCSYMQGVYAYCPTRTNGLDASIRLVGNMMSSSENDYSYGHNSSDDDGDSNSSSGMQDMHIHLLFINH